jgi:hypothetical protein
LKEAINFLLEKVDDLVRMFSGSVELNGWIGELYQVKWRWFGGVRHLRYWFIFNIKLWITE